MVRELQSNILFKGYKHGNEYIVVKNPDESFYDIYQLVNHLTRDMSVKTIKQVTKSLKNVPDSAIMVSIPTSDERAFLSQHHVTIQQMNVFRIGLDREEKWLPESP